LNIDNTILYSSIALLIAILFAWFLYIYKKNKKQKTPYILLVLRFFSVLSLLLLLINPLWKVSSLYIEKPKLVIAVDNSASISYLGQQENVKSIYSKIQTDEKLNKRFDIQPYTFGDNVTTLKVKLSKVVTLSPNV